MSPMCKVSKAAEGRDILIPGGAGGGLCRGYPKAPIPVLILSIVDCIVTCLRGASRLKSLLKKSLNTSVALPADIILFLRLLSQRSPTGDQTWGQRLLMTAPPRSAPALAVLPPQMKKKSRSRLRHGGRRLGTSCRPGRRPQRSRRTFKVILRI